MSTNDTTNPSTPPETQAPPKEAGTDWKAEARKWESRAKENAAAAARLAEIEEAQKSEAEKAAERLAAAEARAAALEADLLRATVAADKGVPVELLNGSTREEIESSADALLAFKGAESVAPHVPAEGEAPAPLALNGDGIENALRQALHIL